MRSRWVTFGGAPDYSVWLGRNWPERLAMGGVVAVTLSTNVTIVFNAGSIGPSYAAVSAALLTIATTVLVLGVRWRLRGKPLGQQLMLIGVQAAVVLLHSVWIPDPSFGIELSVGWLMLIFWSPLWGWLGYAGLVVFSLLRFHNTYGQEYSDSPYQYLKFLFVILALFMLSGAMVRCVVVLAQLGGVIGQLKAAEERNRIHRDLHDALGYTLTAIRLRGELAERLMSVDPERALQEIRDVQAMAGVALADVRRVARGEKRTTFKEGLAEAVALLESKGTMCHLDIADDSDGGSTDAMGWVVREAATNVSRHSDATVCTITARIEDGWFRLTIENDGAVERTDAKPGTGLRGMAARIECLGGRVEHSFLPGGRFRLVVVVPSGAPGERGKVA